MKKFNISAGFTNNLKQLPIRVSLFWDDQVLWSEQVVDSAQFNLDLDDEVKCTHAIKIRFEGKTGVEDADTHLTVDYLKVNDHSLDYILQNTAKYYHSYNSPDLWDQEMDYTDTIGIDGDLSFKIETPVAFWIGKQDKW